MSGGKLSDTDISAWQAATKHVQPLHERGQMRAAKPPRSLDHPAPTLAPPGRAKRAGLPPLQNRQNERPVKRGKQVVSASYDLHGHTQDTAWRALPIFLARQQAQGARCVIVITGKGKLGDGVLRRNFLHWLEMSHARSLVSGYAPAHPRHGGSGAWYVYLRKR